MQRREPKPTEVQDLYRYTGEWRFFTSPDGQVWAQPTENVARQYYPIDHSDVRDFLVNTFQDKHGFPPTAGSLRNVIAGYHANAAHNGWPHSPTLRTTWSRDRQTVAINTGKGDAWEITPQTTSLSDENYRFFHGRGSLPLPDRPAAESDTACPTALAELRQLLHLSTEADWLRTLSWLHAAWRPEGPYPILILQGPTACGKTQTARILRDLVDPNASPLNALPRSGKRLQQQAYEHWVLAFDQVRRFPPNVADTLCGLSTGITYDLPLSKNDYIPIHQCRPILLTVPEKCDIPEDIASRALFVQQAELTAETRRSEEEVLADYARLRPQLLSYQLNAIKSSLAHLPDIHWTRLPRMADAAKWVASAAEVLQTTEELLQQALEPRPNELVVQIELDRAGGQQKTLVLAGDGSFCNRTCFRAQRERTELICRTRKDAVLCRRAPQGGRRFYATEKFTPEQVRKDEAQAWKETKIFYGGKRRKVRYKEVAMIYWQGGAGRCPLRLLVIAPTPYRKRKSGKLYYRLPAFLLTTDLKSSPKQLLQIYFDRWQIEVNHRDEKDTLGVGQAQLWNVQAVPKQPVLVVAAYSALLLASLIAFGAERGAAYEPLPKWRRKAYRPSCLDLVTLLRKEMAQHPELLKKFDGKITDTQLVRAAAA